MLHESLLEKSKCVLEFKQKSLSLLAASKPILVLGQTNVDAVIKHIHNLNVMVDSPSKTRGFCNMSELWMNNDPSLPTELDALVKPILDQVQFIVSVRLRTRMKVFKAVIDTIDQDSCILPHGDDFFHHQLALRVHIPLITSQASLGFNFHPITLDPLVWRMSKVGRIYAFNNFEPHTVTKLDAGVRSHLIMDLVVHDLTHQHNVSPDEMKSVLLGFGKRNGDDYSPNFITHTNSNLKIRNCLAAKYGGAQHNSLPEQMAPENVTLTRQWIQELARDAILKSQVLVF